MGRELCSSGDRASGCGIQTILAVEDEEGLRDLIKEILELEGYTVLTAAHGAEALAVAREHPGGIDLLLTDVVMPRMNGPELAEKLVTLRPGIRALYMSGYTRGNITELGIPMEGVSLLGKPFTQEGLARAVRAALHGNPG